MRVIERRRWILGLAAALGVCLLVLALGGKRERGAETFGVFLGPSSVEGRRIGREPVQPGASWRESLLAEVPGPGEAQLGTGEPRCVVEVVDPLLRPVAGADVSVRLLSGDFDHLGATREDGTVEVDRPGALEKTVWIARHRDFAPGERAFFDELPRTIRIRLSEKGSITGILRRVSGGPPPPGSAVLCWPSRLRPFRTDVTLERIERDPRFVLSPVEDDGRFELSGLDRTREYTVTAGGGGYVLPRELEGVPVGGEEVLLELVPLFAVELKYVLPDGSPPPMAPGGSFSDPGSRVMRDPNVRPMSGSFVETTLAGIDPASRNQPPYRETWLYTSSDDSRERVGPVEHRAAPMGYRPVAANVFADRVDRGTVPWEVVLIPTASGRGSIELHLQGLQAGPCASWSRSRKAGLYLKGGGGVYVLPIADLREPVHVLEDVAAGSYQYFFSTSNRGLRVPRAGYAPAILEIADGETSRLEIDLGDTGAIRLRLRLGAREYDGRVVFLLADRRTPEGYPAGTSCTFQEGPYALCAVRPGSYELLLSKPRALSETVPLEVRAGECTELSLDLDS